MPAGQRDVARTLSPINVNASSERKAEEAPPLAEGDVIDGRYRVEGIIGRGGMGLVVAAVHLQLGKRVAVKLLAAEATGNEVVRQRFLREARAAAHLRNEHVVRVLDFGVLESGSPVIVMELLRGFDLERELCQRGPLPPEYVVDLLLQVCEALAEAHAQGVIHRDLKPSNLFVERAADGSPHIKVLDFGVSKNVRGRSISGRSEQSLTAANVVVGSPTYMAPEQVKGDRPTDGRTDTWALGVILFELLTDTRPFDEASLPVLFASIVHDKPPMLRTRCQHAPQELEDLVRWSLEKDPEVRCPDVATFAQRLAASFPSPLRQDAAARVRRVASASLHDFETEQLHPESPGARAENLSNWALTSHSTTSPKTDRPRARYAVVAGVGALLVLLGVVLWRVAPLDRNRSAAAGAASHPASPASSAVRPSEPPPAASSAPDEPSVGDASRTATVHSAPVPAAPPRSPPARHKRARAPSSTAPPAPPDREEPGRDPLEDRK